MSQSEHHEHTENGKPLVPHLIGIGGHSGAGKDTAAAILVARFGFERHGLADLMKDGLVAIDPYIPLESPLLNKDGSNIVHMRRLTEMLAEYGRAGMTLQQAWDQVKLVPEVRRLLQRFGTQFGRNLMHPSLWIEFMFAKLGDPPPERVVVPDIRFANESDWIREHHGLVVRIDRPNVGPLNEHESEDLRDVRFDTQILNDGTFEDLAEKLAVVMMSLKVSGRGGA